MIIKIVDFDKELPLVATFTSSSGSGKVGKKINTAGTIFADFRKLTKFYKLATGWILVL